MMEVMCRCQAIKQLSPVKSLISSLEGRKLRFATSSNHHNVFCSHVVIGHLLVENFERMLRAEDLNIHQQTFSQVWPSTVFPMKVSRQRFEPASAAFPMEVSRRKFERPSPSAYFPPTFERPTSKTLVKFGLDLVIAQAPVYVQDLVNWTTTP